jgi:hypothetical protein
MGTILETAGIDSMELEAMRCAAEPAKVGYAMTMY